MAAKAIMFILVLAANTAIAAVCGFFLLLSLNGFSESDAMWGIAAFVLLALLISIGSAAFGAVLIHHLTARSKWRPLPAVMVTVVLTVLAGGMLNLFSIAAAAIVANTVRTNF